MSRVPLGKTFTKKNENEGACIGQPSTASRTAPGPRDTGAEELGRWGVWPSLSSVLSQVDCGPGHTLTARCSLAFILYVSKSTLRETAFFSTKLARRVSEEKKQKTKKNSISTHRQYFLHQ